MERDVEGSRGVVVSGPVGTGRDEQADEAQEWRERARRTAEAHGLAVESYRSLGRGVMQRIADHGSLADVLEYVGNHMNSRDHVDDELIALFERAKAAAEPRPVTSLPAHDDLPDDCENPRCVQIAATVQRAVRGVKSFADEMREKGIHVGLGELPRCVVCDKPWPCPESKGGES